MTTIAYYIGMILMVCGGACLALVLLCIAGCWALWYGQALFDDVQAWCRKRKDAGL